MPAKVHAECVINKLIEANILIPDKQEIYLHKYKNGRINETCQRYIFNLEFYQGAYAEEIQKHEMP
jgi:hypothetical protein